MKLLDFNDPYYKPLWIRIAIVAVAGGWALVELLAGSPGWAMLFGAAAALAFHGLFVTFKPRDKPDAGKPGDGKG